MDGATDERGAKTAAPSDPHTLRSALCAVSMAVPVVAAAWALGRTDRDGRHSSEYEQSKRTRDNSVRGECLCD